MNLNYKTQKIINKLTGGLTEMGANFTPSDIWYNLKYGIRNLKSFFWIIWKWRNWDHIYTLNLFSKGIEIYLKESQFSYAIEIDETRLPKEANMKRVIEIINNIDKSNYIEKAEKELGEIIFNQEFVKKSKDDKEVLYRLVDNSTKEERDHRVSVYKFSDKLEQDEWSELWEILKKDSQGWWN